MDDSLPICVPNHGKNVATLTECWQNARPIHDLSTDPRDSAAFPPPNWDEPSHAIGGIAADVYFAALLFWRIARVHVAMSH